MSNFIKTFKVGLEEKSNIEARYVNHKYNIHVFFKRNIKRFMHELDMSSMRTSFTYLQNFGWRGRLQDHTIKF